MPATNDLDQIYSRISDFQKKACQADEVVIALGCSDSRVRFPTDFVTVHNKEKKECKVLFIMIPTIGGGAPSRTRLKRVIDDIVAWGVAASKIKILVTQHGNTQEISQRIGHYGFSTEPTQLVSCGLRKFFAQYAQELSYLHTLLLQWSDRHRQNMSQQHFIPDGISLRVLENECPEAYDLISQISPHSTDSQYKLPRRLIFRAAYRNANFDIEENGETVRSRVAEYLREPEFANVFATCTVGLADYDHNQKSLHFIHSYSSLEWQEKVIELPQLPHRSVSFQDPQAAVITFGKELLPIPDAVLFPQVCSEPDNTFRATVSTPSAEIFLCAMAEISYAVLHRVLRHDDNFKSLSELRIISDTKPHIKIVENIMYNQEFVEDFLPLFSAFSPTGATLIDISDPEAVKTKRVKFNQL